MLNYELFAGRSLIEEQVGNHRLTKGWRLVHLVLAATLLHLRTLEQRILQLSGLRPCKGKPIRKVWEDMERFKFNTIAAMMEFSNKLNQAWQSGNIDSNVWGESIMGLVLMIAPITPFLAQDR